MMKDLLLVVDMQNVYKEGAPWGCRNTDEVIRKIRKLADSGLPEQVIFTRFDAPQNPHGTWQAYNEEFADINSDIFLNEMMEELQPYAEKYPVYSKDTYSSYSIKEVRDAVKEADRVLLTGVVAECCILATLESLIDAGVKVLYLKDAIAGQTSEFEAVIEKIAKSFSTIHTEVITVEDYLHRPL